jgi:glycosyltransferase involved in cell wall biosynthesis
MLSKIAIYPDVQTDGIGTYIRGINYHLNIPVIKSRYSLLSPLQFIKSVPKYFQVLHVPHFVVPLRKGEAKIVCTIQDVTPLILPDVFTTQQLIYLKFRIYWSLKSADHLIFTSKNTYQDVVRIFGKVSNSTVIPLAVDEPIAIDKIPKINYPFSYFFCVGRRRPHKNTEGIIKAFASMSKSSDTHLVFGGRQDIHDAQYLKLANDLGITNRVHFTGYLSQVQLAAHYQSAIALVFPSLYEGFGLPILEAMSYGCPVITSNVASMPEVAGNAAMFVDPCDNSNLANAMNALRLDSGLRNELTFKGLERAKQFSWKKTADQTRNVYEQL